MELELSSFVQQLAKRTLSPTHLDIAALGVSSREEWASLGTMLGRLGSASRWWMGDWLLWGEDHVGEEYAQFVSELGLSEETLMRYARVARAWPPELRRGDVSYSVHELARHVPDEHKSELLERYVEEGWGRGDLVRYLREHGWTRGGHGKGRLSAEADDAVSVMVPAAEASRPSHWEEDDWEDAEDIIEIEEKPAFGDCPLCRRPFRGKEEWEAYRRRLLERQR